MPKISYINTETQSKVRTENVQMTGGVGTNDHPETLPAKGFWVQQS